MNLYIRCACSAHDNEPLTARAARITSLLASPELRNVAGERWTSPVDASGTDAPEPIVTLSDLRIWTPAPATNDVAYRLARTNGREGDRRCDVVATLWMESSEPDQLVIRLRRDRFPGGSPANLDELTVWLRDRVRGLVEVSFPERTGPTTPIAAK